MIPENKIERIISKENAGERLDKWMIKNLACKAPGDEYLVSRNQAQKWIEEGLVRVTGDPTIKSDPRFNYWIIITDKNYKLHEGESVCVNGRVNYYADEEVIQPQDIPLDIIYEDDFLLVVNKPKGMVVHPAPGNPDNTLVNALMFHCGGRLATCNGEERRGILHRIDKDTSGLLVVAKDDRAYIGLAEQVKAHTMNRFYEAVVYGRVKQESGTIDLPIGRSSKDRKKMAIIYSNQARNAVTHFRVVEVYEHFTHIRCQLETGRTHQIRVHMAATGHPIAGDSVYGPRKAIKSLQGQCLHARALGFFHPITGEKLYFESNMPDYFLKFLRTL